MKSLNHGIDISFTKGLLASKLPVQDVWSAMSNSTCTWFMVCRPLTARRHPVKCQKSFSVVVTSYPILSRVCPSIGMCEGSMMIAICSNTITEVFSLFVPSPRVYNFPRSILFDSHQIHALSGGSVLTESVIHRAHHSLDSRYTLSLAISQPPRHPFA